MDSLAMILPSDADCLSKNTKNANKTNHATAWYTIRLKKNEKILLFEVLELIFCNK